MTYAKALQEAKDTCKECLTVNDCVKEECRWYLIIKALEKQIPKKPINEYDNYAGGILHHCPNCNTSVQRHGMFGELFINPMHCMCCGQAIDWSDTE